VRPEGNRRCRQEPCNVRHVGRTSLEETLILVIINAGKSFLYLLSAFPISIASNFYTHPPRDDEPFP